MRERTVILPILLTAVTLLAAACSAGDASSASSTESTASTASEPVPTSRPAGPSASPSAEGRSSQESVTVVLDWTPNTNHTGLYVAKQQGWYTDAGLDVEIIQPGEQGSLAAVASGAAEFGVSVQEEIVPARAQGVPVVSIAAILASNTSSFVALADEGIAGPADFPGHRYGGFGGPLETALVRTLVSCEGGDPDAVDFVDVGNVDYRIGLERDHYDFVWIFEGWDGIRLRELADVEVTTVPLAEHFDCIPDWYTPLLATSETVLADRPDLVAAFMEATARGYDYAMEDPDAAADALLEAVPELDAALVRASQRYLADEYAASGEAWGQQSQQVWQRFAEFLAEAGLVEEVIDVRDAYTNDFLPPVG